MGIELLLLYFAKFIWTFLVFAPFKFLLKFQVKFCLVREATVFDKLRKITRLTNYINSSSIFPFCPSSVRLTTIVFIYRPKSPCTLFLCVFISTFLTNWNLVYLKWQFFSQKKICLPLELNFNEGQIGHLTRDKFPVIFSWQSVSSTFQMV